MRRKRCRDASNLLISDLQRCAAFTEAGKFYILASARDEARPLGLVADNFPGAQPLQDTADRRRIPATDPEGCNGVV